MNNNYIVAGVAVASLTIGAASGYFFAKRKFSNTYEEIIEREVREAREFYKRTYKADEYGTPESTAEVLLEEATEAIRSYQGEPGDPLVESVQEHEDPDLPDEEQEVEERNIFDDGDQLKIDKSDRSPDKPYVVDLDEYMSNQGEYEQVSLTFYEGDNVLADDDDRVIDQVNIVGRMNLNMFGASDPEQPHVVLIRNEKFKTDYEITHSDGKYAHEVMGLMHSDEERRRPPRPQWDDDEG